jgi:hypothetical protein
MGPRTNCSRGRTGDDDGEEGGMGGGSGGGGGGVGNDGLKVVYVPQCREGGMRRRCTIRLGALGARIDNDSLLSQREEGGCGCGSGDFREGGGGII